MFQIDDYIIYGADNVCRVVENNLENINLKCSDKKYYKLEPVFENKSTIYTPVDNDRVAMRKVLTKDEALSLIAGIYTLENYSYDDKLREEKYKEVMHNHNCRELISMLKTAYYIKRERLSANKNVISVDKKNAKIIEGWLSEEFSVSLGISREEAKELINKEIKDSYNIENKI